MGAATRRQSAGQVASACGVGSQPQQVTAIKRIIGHNVTSQITLAHLSKLLESSNFMDRAGDCFHWKLSSARHARQVHPGAQSASRAVLQHHRAAMAFDDRLDQGQAQASAAGRFVARAFQTDKGSNTRWRSVSEIPGPSSSTTTS